MAEGATVQGTVVNAAHVDWTQFSRGFSETYALRYAIRVTFPDGSQDDVICDVPLHQVQKLAGNRTIECWEPLAKRTRIGTTVPMRYEASDHSRVVLDLPALIHELLREADARKTDGAVDDPAP